MKTYKNNTEAKIQRVIEYSVMMMLIAYFVFAARVLRSAPQAGQIVIYRLPSQPVEVNTNTQDAVVTQSDDKQQPERDIVSGSDMDFEKINTRPYSLSDSVTVEEVDTDGPVEKEEFTMTTSPRSGA